MWATDRGSLVLTLLMFSFFLTVYSNAESDALIAFKSSLSDPNKVLTSWDDEELNPCTWFRITCNNDNYATIIYLGNKNLSGQLVPQLGLLSNLMYLELYNNKISVKIPPAGEFEDIGELESLP